MSVNDEIDKLRNSATASLGERGDVIVVASVSCIYGLGAPEEYFDLAISLRPGDTMPRDELLRRLIELQYERKDIDFSRSSFRCARGYRRDLPGGQFGDRHPRRIFRGRDRPAVRRRSRDGQSYGGIEAHLHFPASHYAVGSQKMQAALAAIERDLDDEVKAFREDGKLLEAQRLEQRTRYDLEMMREVGYCSGVENYSRYFDGRSPGEPPFTLLDYFPDDFLVFIDESHMTIPQIRRDVSRGSFPQDESGRIRVPYAFVLRQQAAHL